MNIGVSLIGFQTHETLRPAIEPWKKVNELGVHSIKISCSQGVFPEVAELGYKAEDDKETREEFKKLLSIGLVDNYIFTDVPTYEFQLRNLTLPYLFSAFNGEDMNYLVILDGDEVYKSEDIISIFTTVRKHGFIEWFKVRFTNFIKFKGRPAKYSGFVVPRIFKHNIHNGIRGFYYDNDIEYHDGKKTSELAHLIINKPEVTHLSWVGSDEYLKRKVDFANKHYKTCSFLFGPEGLDFNKEYYLKTGKEMPIIEYLD